MNPHIFREKLDTAYLALAGVIAGEGAVTDHAKRQKVMRQMLLNECPFDRLIMKDLASRGYDSTTAQSDITARITALVPILVALGFGD